MRRINVLQYWLLGVAAFGVLVAIPMALPLRGAQNVSLIFSMPTNAGQPVRMAVDPQGYIYLAGQVSAPYPAPAFVTKLTPAGAVVYTTYLQATRFIGEPGDCLVDITAIAADRNGAAYVTGCTTAIDFPLVNPLRSTFQGWRTSGFVTKLSASGTIVYSTYFGTGGGAESGSAIAADDDGNAYVVGSGTGELLPLVNPAHRTGIGYAAKFNATGTTLLYSTYLGATPRAIAVDRSGSAYIAGKAGLEFPAVRPLQACHGGESDAFVIKLNASGGAYDYATCLGGSRGDEATGIAIDASGSAYVVGTTRSMDFPTARPLEVPRTGPLWRTADGGDTWVNLPLDSSSVYALLPSSATAGAWYAGTLEGVFKSSDRGTHWRHLLFPDRDSSFQPSVIRMATDKRQPSVVYASTSDGLFKSSDGGERWVEIGASLPGHGAYLRGLEVDPGDSRVVYAAGVRGFWKSVDAGLNWVPSNQGLGTDPHVDTLLVDARTGVLYADILVTDGIRSLDRLYTSTDGGANWSSTSLEIRQRTITALVASQPRIRRNPPAERSRGEARSTTEPASIYVAAEQVFSGGPFGVLFRSDDGARSWQSIGRGLPEKGAAVLVVASDDSGSIYAASGGLIFVSTDRGETFEAVTNGPAFEWVVSLTVDPTRAATVLVGVSATTDAFAARIRPGGAALEYSTYLGGAGEERAFGVVVDDLGRATVFGTTYSSDFPASGAIKPPSRNADGFVSVVDGGGAVLLASTRVGGPGTDTLVSAVRSGSGTLIAGGTTDLAGMFPGSTARGAGAFIASISR